MRCRRVGKRVPIQVQVTLESTGTMLLGTEIGAALATLEVFDVDVDRAELRYWSERDE